MGALSPSRHVRAQIELRVPTFILQCYGRRYLPSDTNPDENIRQPLQSKRETHVIHSKERGASMPSTPRRVVARHPSAPRRPSEWDGT